MRLIWTNDLDELPLALNLILDELSACAEKKLLLVGSAKLGKLLGFLIKSNFTALEKEIAPFALVRFWSYIVSVCVPTINVS